MQQVYTFEAVSARRRIPLFLFDDDAADAYAPKTGLTFSAAEIQISKNGAAEVNSAGTVVEVGGGIYYYQAAVSELDTVGFLSVRPVKTDVYGAPAIVQIVGYNPYNSANMGLTNLDTTITSRLPTTTYETVDNLLDKANAIEAGVTPRGALRLMLSVLAGKLSGAGTGTETFRNAVADSKARVTATVDTSGNRTTITTDQT